MPTNNNLMNGVGLVCKVMIMTKLHYRSYIYKCESNKKK